MTSELAKVRFISRESLELGYILVDLTAKLGKVASLSSVVCSRETNWLVKSSLLHLYFYF